MHKCWTWQTGVTTRILIISHAANPNTRLPLSATSYSNVHDRTDLYLLLCTHIRMSPLKGTVNVKRGSSTAETCSVSNKKTERKLFSMCLFCLSKQVQYQTKQVSADYVNVSISETPNVDATCLRSGKGHGYCSQKRWSSLMICDIMLNPFPAWKSHTPHEHHSNARFCLAHWLIYSTTLASRRMGACLIRFSFRFFLLTFVALWQFRSGEKYPRDDCPFGPFPAVWYSLAILNEEPHTVRLVVEEPQISSRRNWVRVWVLTSVQYNQFCWFHQEKNKRCCNKHSYVEAFYWRQLQHERPWDLYECRIYCVLFSGGGNLDLISWPRLKLM